MSGFIRFLWKRRFCDGVLYSALRLQVVWSIGGIYLSCVESGLRWEAALYFYVGEVVMKCVIGGEGAASES